MKTPRLNSASLRRRCFWWLTLTVIATPHLVQPVSAQGAPVGAVPAVTPKPAVNRLTGAAPDANWAEEYAYSLGVQAYVYAFPWYYNSLLRWKWTTQKPSNATTPFGPVNQFWHQGPLMDADYRDGGRPNNDTLYSVAWVDVSQEPLIVSVPEMQGRYYSIQLASFDADNFDYVGTRATGSKAGHYAIVGPHWRGKLPPGVKALASSPTNWALALGRTLVDGPDDLSRANQKQAQMTLTPLSQWGKSAGKGAAPQATRDAVLPPFDRKTDPMADWKTINRAMTEINPPARDAQLIKMFAKIGVGPGQDVDKVDAATKRGLLRALATGKTMVTSAGAYSAGYAEANGWSMAPTNFGRLGQDGEYLYRAAKSLGAIISNDAQENVYYSLTEDTKGERLNGGHRYVLHFDKGQLPPAYAFWSITAYDTDYNLIANPIHRYAVGDRTKGLKLDADGGLTLHVQKDAPGADKASNWFPVGPGEFHFRMRLYFPKPEAANNTWQPPKITTLE